MDFAHLRTATHASLKHGLMDVEELVAYAKENGHTTLALTDANTLSQAVVFYKECQKNGIKPIIGLEASIECDLTQPSEPGESKPTSSKILLLAKNASGYRKIMDLITKSNIENIVDGQALIKQSWLKEFFAPEGTDPSSPRDVVALSGTPQTGEIPRLICDETKTLQEISKDLRPVLSAYRNIFGPDFFLEISRNDNALQDVWVERTVQLSQATGIPVVATHGVMFGAREDFFPHEIHAAITTGQAIDDPSYVPASTREQYYRSTAEMEELFSDIPEALENAGLVAQKCSPLLELGVNHLPNYPVPEGQNLNDEFVKQSEEGLAWRLEQLFPDPQVRAEKQVEYSARLKEEIDVILNMDFPGYFLVVSDFIRWSKSQGIPVGPGRGSGAGSLVAYSLAITDIDPIEHNLLFERFLNPERVSMPDIDIDFCRDRRDETIGYIFDRYGAESVAQISTFSTLAAKAAIRHVGKVLNYPLPFVDQIARLVPGTVGISLDAAMEEEPRLQEMFDNDKRARRILSMAKKVEGRYLTTGVHAGGVIIAPGKITEYASMQRAQGKDVMVTQFDKDDAEESGLIKFDLLGLKTLTSINQAVGLINQRPERKDNPLDLAHISLEDKNAIELIKSAKTYGVFQLEGGGMRKLLASFRPDCFEDVTAALALYRPGPLNSGMVDSFVKRKHGEEDISYYHERLEELLKPTYGIIVYQEQVMQIAQAIAGYSLGGADLLRRAMGKKKPEEMAKERVKFEEGAAKNGVDPKLATELFDVMEKFAEYGFNRSHSAAYAMLSIQTAYIKANYPAEFFASYMNIELGNTDVLALATRDARDLGLEIGLPNINEGEVWFQPQAEEKRVVYGLAALKGASQNVINDIVECRKQTGDFTSLKDFLYRVNDYLRAQGRNMQMKQTAESLIRAGAFDKLNPNRAELIAQLAEELDYIGKLNKRHASSSSVKGDVLLPALWESIGVEAIPAPVKTRANQKPLVEPGLPDPSSYKTWTELERLQNENRALGFMLSAHPYGAHARELGGFLAGLPLHEFENTEDFSSHLIGGVVEDIFERTYSGRKIVNVTIGNGHSSKRVTVFEDQFTPNAKKFKVGAFLAFEASFKPSRNPQYPEKNVTAQQVFDKNDLNALLVQKVNIACTKEELSILQDLQKEHGGKRITTSVYIPDGEDRFFRADLPNVKWADTPDALSALKDKFQDRVEFSYAEQLSFSKPKAQKQFNNRSFKGKP